MTESYSAPDALGLDAMLPASVVQELLGRLLPGAKGALLLDALRAERASGGAGAAQALIALDGETSAAARELGRVRRVFAAGELSLGVHLAMNNTLTALQTEAQLLELEPLADEHRRASTRIVELTRRLATVMRRLEPASGAFRG